MGMTYYILGLLTPFLAYGFVRFAAKIWEYFDPTPKYKSYRHQKWAEENGYS